MKACQCRRYCLSVKGLRQRYDEDIEEAMEDGFQGPVAKALHAFDLPLLQFWTFMVFVLLITLSMLLAVILDPTELHQS